LEQFGTIELEKLGKDGKVISKKFFDFSLETSRSSSRDRYVNGTSPLNAFLKRKKSTQ